MSAKGTSTLIVGAKVITGVGPGKKGVIMFIGETQFSAGEWIGIRLDTPEGKNDGSVGDTRYFECEANHGLFARRAQVRLDRDTVIDSKDRLAALRAQRKEKPVKDEIIEDKVVISSGETTRSEIIVRTDESDVEADPNNVVPEADLDSSEIDNLKSQLREEREARILLQGKIDGVDSLNSEVSTLKAENQRLKDENTVLRSSQQQEGTSDSKGTQLESQVNELMEALEMLTLDKEQLIIDNEMLEESLKKLQTQQSQNLGDSSSRSTTELNNEISKLRDALRRLNDVSKSEKDDMQKKLDDAQLKLGTLDDMAIELQALKSYKDDTTKKIVELQQSVDSSSSYEEMIEILTEKNLELTSKINQLNVTISDLEDAQELLEELDANQRQELDSARKAHGKAEILLAEKEREFLFLISRHDELKNQVDKQKHLIDDLKGKIQEDHVQISIHEEEVNEQFQRLKVVSSAVVQRESQQIDICNQRLEYMCMRHDSVINSFSLSRWESILTTSCAIFSSEQQHLNQETNAVGTTIICHNLIDFFQMCDLIDLNVVLPLLQAQSLCLEELLLALHRNDGESGSKSFIFFNEIRQYIVDIHNHVKDNVKSSMWKTSENFFATVRQLQKYLALNESTSSASSTVDYSTQLSIVGYTIKMAYFIDSIYRVLQYLICHVEFEAEESKFILQSILTELKDCGLQKNDVVAAESTCLCEIKATVMDVLNTLNSISNESVIRANLNDKLSASLQQIRFVADLLKKRGGQELQRLLIPDICSWDFLRSCFLDSSLVNANKIWQPRVEQYKHQLKEWEEALSEVVSIKSRLSSVQDNFDQKDKQLRAANDRIKELTLTGSLETSTSGGRESEGPNISDIKTLQEEVKVVNDALDIMTRKYDVLEKENKNLKVSKNAAGVASDSSSSPSSDSLRVQLALWKSLASHKMTSFLCDISILNQSSAESHQRVQKLQSLQRASKVSKASRKIKLLGFPKTGNE